jgi:ATP adenylyltransferase
MVSRAGGRVLADPNGARDPNLPAAIERCTRDALASGALVPIATEERFVDDEGVRFVLRAVSTLARKRDAGVAARPAVAAATDPVNPFLPYDPRLFVADIGATHVCLLNKFPVICGHLLIVTRAFEHQETLLTKADCGALAAGLAEIDGLGFYNGGAAAGASQPHKHLQIVPLPLARDGPRVPIEPKLAFGLRPPGDVRDSSDLPFRHAFVALEPSLFRQPRERAGAIIEARYRALLDALNIGAVAAGGGVRQSAAYNLLMTRGWMLLVRRAHEHFGAISVNALGFAGSLFVRDEGELRVIESEGPMRILQSVAGDGPDKG